MSDTAFSDDSLREQLHQYVAASLRDELTASEAEALENLVLENETARSIYVDEIFAWQTMLTWSNESLVESDSPSRWSRTWLAARDVANNYITLSLLIAAITMAVIVLSLGVIRPKLPLPQPGPAAPVFVAEITATRGAIWDAASAGDSRNVSLFSGDRLMLNEGLAEITYSNGARVYSGIASGLRNPWREGRLSRSRQADRPGRARRRPRVHGGNDHGGVSSTWAPNSVSP